MESVHMCVMLDGDHVVALNPAPLNETEYFHSTLALLFNHHLGNGYRHFVINHIWRTDLELADLCQRLRAVDAKVVIHSFLLSLSLKENLRRIERRQSSRAINESEFEAQTVQEERKILFSQNDSKLGEIFDVSATPEDLVKLLLSRLSLR